MSCFTHLLPFCFRSPPLMWVLTPATQTSSYLLHVNNKAWKNCSLLWHFSLRTPQITHVFHTHAMNNYTGIMYNCVLNCLGNVLKYRITCIVTSNLSCNCVLHMCTCVILGMSYLSGLFLDDLLWLQESRMERLVFFLSTCYQ